VPDAFMDCGPQSTAMNKEVHQIDWRAGAGRDRAVFAGLSYRIGLASPKQGYTGLKDIFLLCRI
jgi:hypothetical protein